MDLQAFRCGFDERQHAGPVVLAWILEDRIRGHDSRQVVQCPRKESDVAGTQSVENTPEFRQIFRFFGGGRSLCGLLGRLVE